MNMKYTENSLIFASMTVAGFCASIAFIAYANLQTGIEQTQNTITARIQIPVEIISVDATARTVTMKSVNVPGNPLVSARFSPSTVFEERTPKAENNVVIGLTPAKRLTPEQILTGSRGLARVTPNAKGELELQLLVVGDPFLSAPY